MLGLIKKISPIQQLARRAPPFYPAARGFLRRYDGMSASARADEHRSLESALVTAARNARAYADLSDLASAPLLTKGEVRANPSHYRAKTLLPVSAGRTSGTSGASLEVARSLAQVMFEQAVIDWLVAKAGLNFATAKVAVLRADTIKPPEDRAPPFWKISADRRIATLSAHHLDDETFPAYADMLDAFAPDVLYAYPSMAIALATLSTRAKRPLRFKLALTSSEELPPPSRAKLADVFGAKVIDYYGQAERVAFAYSTEPGQYVFHAGYGKVELLRDAGGAVEIVGSNYHNRAQFLLRYRTGDQIVLGASSDLDAIARGEVSFAGVSGRASDVVYGPAGEVFLGLNHIPRPFDQIEGLQIVQTGPGKVRILVRSQQDRSDALAAQILATARTKIGPVVDIELAFVDAFHKSAAGKQPFVIHEWKPAA